VTKQPMAKEKFEKLSKSLENGVHHSLEDMVQQYKIYFCY